MATHTAQIAPKTVLATFPSKSNPSKQHSVCCGADGVIYCTCNSWRFQKETPSKRTCCHTEAWVAQVTHGGATLRTQEVVPSPKPAQRAKRATKKAAFWTLL